MPGILPMKVIKVGSNAQSRVAQACDRCRSKKIRCDGVTPCCSQCANVGFECKTSDKLSRRAFPRGYTESLEERVRALEGEVRELKDLLDSKDEKIDMLSRIHPSSPPTKRPTSVFSSSTNPTSPASSTDPHGGKEDASIDVGQQSTGSGDDDISTMSSASASNGKCFIDAFKARLKARNPKTSSSIRTQSFFDCGGAVDAPASPVSDESGSPPPSRMASDQMINVFFQEWSPLFPILHRPTTLKLYADFVADHTSIDSPHDVAQLYLTFGIAAVSAEWNKHDPIPLERMWQAALEQINRDISVPTLQCFLLGALYCIAKGDHERLGRYRAIIANLVRRLGLHQSQKRSSLGPLLTESRKRLFWVSFTLDCFSGSILGQPRLLNDLEAACEYPQDVDDEYITEKEFLTMPPGESTRVSSALALFNGARILSAVLDRIYPTSMHNVTPDTIRALNEDLDDWLSDLAPHLRLRFMQDKPSTQVVGSRSAFLSLTYHYIRTLLYRPVAASGKLGVSSSVPLAQSSKHIIQLVQLLEERRMSFSFCLNRSSLIALAGIGISFQTLDYGGESKLVQESLSSLHTATQFLERSAFSGTEDFRKIVAAVANLPNSLRRARSELNDSRSRIKASSTMPAPKSPPRHMRKASQSQRQRAKAFPVSPLIKQEAKEGYPMGHPSIPPMPFGEASQLSQESIAPYSPPQYYNNHRPYSFPAASSRNVSDQFILPNLDYLDFSNEPATFDEQHQSPNIGGMKGSLAMSSPGQTMENSISTGDGFPYLGEVPSASKSFGWSSDLWTMSPNLNGNLQPTQSSLSLSEEELTSGEELSSCGTSGHFPTTSFASEHNGLGVTGMDGFNGGFVL